jgi:hypothetical protein
MLRLPRRICLVTVGANSSSRHKLAIAPQVFQPSRRPSFLGVSLILRLLFEHVYPVQLCAPENTELNLSLPGRTIAILANHGGCDPGGISPGVRQR